MSNGTENKYRFGIAIFLLSLTTLGVFAAWYFLNVASGFFAFLAVVGTTTGIDLLYDAITKEEDPIALRWFKGILGVIITLGALFLAVSALAWQVMQKMSLESGVLNTLAGFFPIGICVLSGITATVFCVEWWHKHKLAGESGGMIKTQAEKAVNIAEKPAVLLSVVTVLLIFNAIFQVGLGLLVPAFALFSFSLLWYPVLDSRLAGSTAMIAPSNTGATLQNYSASLSTSTFSTSNYSSNLMSSMPTQEQKVKQAAEALMNSDRKAIKYYSDLVRAEPNNAEYICRLAIAKKLFVEDYSAELKQMKNISTIHVLLNRIGVALGTSEAAQRAYSLELEITPNHLFALRNKIIVEHNLHYEEDGIRSDCEGLLKISDNKEEDQKLVNSIFTAQIQSQPSQPFVI